MSMKTFCPKMYQVSFNCRRTGFTLLEILIGISLSLVVLGGVLAVYTPTLQSWRATTSLGEIQDIEATLHDILGTNIRQAGLVGCGLNVPIIDGIDLPRGPNTLWAFSNAGAFMSSTFSAEPARTTTPATAITNLFGNLVNRLHVDGSNYVGDIIVTLAPADGFHRIATSTTGVGNKVIQFTTPATINEGEFFLVNDCDNTVIVRADSRSTTGALSYTNNLDFGHATNIVVNRFEPAIFYIGRLQPNGAGPTIPTLYRRTLINSVGAGPLAVQDDPILAGVENLRVEFGIASNAVNQDFITHYLGLTAFAADASLTMADVGAVRVTVMLRAEQNNSGSKQTSIMFPKLDGTLVNCKGDGALEADACPSYLNSDADRNKPRKVISFTYQLPREISIITGS